ncbi:hypothetical protein JOB18_007912 [Solea senegalensis]|nr:microtubule organization protein AKNA isoform X1 [Solea senegalensis]XP_043868582.1 microtubule organization protein AKNA isoform X1 [Solea senegalensis]XP_043868583.1 microtubule organization protein AKNA isoform X1 [Solea senegalensis]KAG7498396.1 hypothetical protein JOB18_007912 [Solea senegalensis]KAG7498397.1 hypothetical protein JOB18_007912 [Solea senegalensis]KAG7498403.1 hypothetical protein JOB18_007912 [Solea senegalensis]KAG7498408.1 hypothetical protein JOB18_007912 [Solea se
MSHHQSPHPPGIDAETFPNMDIAESLGSLESSLLESEDEEELHLESFTAPVFTDKPKVIKSGKRASPDASSRQEPRTPGATIMKSDSLRNLCLRKTPDFSKVLPRVHVPKDSKPSVCRRPSARESPSPELHLNPADYVKEALLNTSDVVSNPKVQKTIITLVERLQEDYSKLLIKHAEAENTIDRLRFGAKVNLFSEPPKPSCSVPSELSQHASRSMTLDFPQAQRPELGSASPQTNGHGAEPSLFSDTSALSSSAHHGLNMGQHAAQTLHNQAAKFLQQLLTFEDLLKTKTPPPFQQMKGLLHLFEELNSLEMGYLLARDEHKLQQQCGDDVTPFDCERDLEEQIHQFRLHAEELKEQVEQTLHNKPTCETPPSPPPQSSPSYVHPEGEETRGHPQISPVSGAAESDGQESAVSSSSSSPQWSCTSFSPSHGAAAAAAAATAAQSTSPSVHRQHHHIWAELRKSNSSSLSSLAEIPAPERRESKLQPGSIRTAPPQDGLISPEMDSGFVGSESSRVTPAAAHSPLHQMASQRDLEQLICHARLCTKNLMEMMEGKMQEESACETPPTPPPPPQSTPPSSAVPSEAEEARRFSHVLPPPYASLKVGPGKTESDVQESSVVISSVSSSVGSNPASHRTSVHSTSLFTHPHPHPQPQPQPHSHPRSRPRPRPHAHPHHVQSSEMRESPSRSRSRHQMASQRPDERSWSDEFSEIRQTSWTPLKTSSVVRPKTPQSRMSENSQSDSFTKSFNSLYSSHLSSALPTPHRHGDSLRTTASRQVANHEPEEICSSDEFNELRRTARTPPKESHTVGQKTPQHHRGKPRLAVSFMQPSTSSSQSQPQMNKGLHSSPPAAPADETDSRNRQAPPFCVECSAHRRSERQVRGNRTSPSSSSSSSSSSSCLRCPRCGRLQPHRDTEPDSRRRPESRTHTRCQTAESPDGTTRSRRAVAPPPLPHCMIVGQPLLVYPLPVHVSPSSNSPGSSPGVTRGHDVSRLPPPPPVDQLSSLDSSLNRAIRAARRMRHTSRHMAHSQAQGLHYHKLLSHS